MTVTTDTKPALAGLAATLLACCAVGARAQAPDGVAPEPAPVYDIELIVFEYRDGLRGRREDFAYVDTGRESVRAEREALLSAPMQSVTGDDPDPTLARQRGLDPAAADADRRRGPAAAEAEADNAAPKTEARPLQFEPLPAERWRLTDTADRLRRNGRFETLVHTAWRQPVYGPDEETTLDLARVASLPARLGGAASLYVTRFLHLKLDLDLAHIAAPAPDTDTLIYHLTERRKMRSTELHFFDHPRFGVLALISPVESGPPDATTPGVAGTD